VTQDMCVSDNSCESDIVFTSFYYSQCAALSYPEGQLGGRCLIAPAGRRFILVPIAAQNKTLRWP
jgi:hypothetical protein